MTGGVAKRYARALASVAREENRLEDVAGELESVSSWLVDAELSEALSSPALTLDNRQALVGQITEALDLSPLTKNFLSLLTQKHRLEHFAAIQRAYGEIVDRELGRLRAVLRSAQPLSASQKEDLASALAKKHGKQILLSAEVDPDLVAGITVEIEGKTYDGSARTQLARLARTMSRTGTSG